MKQSMNPGVMKTKKMKKPWNGPPFIWPAVEALGDVESDDLSGFEEEVGREKPMPDLVNVPIDNPSWLRARWATYQTNSAEP